MNKRIALCLFGLLATAAHAGDLCPLVLDLNQFVAAETGYVTPPCPIIGFGALPAAQTLRSQAGAFMPETGGIELAPDLDLTTYYGKSYLLHELVHAAQYANCAQNHVACVAALEAEAYGVQARYLMQVGDREDALALFLLGTELGQCGGFEN